jgi:serine/threonine-protein kinase
LVYVRRGTLFAAPFDVMRLEMTGQPVAVLEGVASNPNTGATQFAVSDSGIAVYLPGRSTYDAPIQLVDQAGRSTALRANPTAWANPAFAPDGRRLAMDISDGNQADVWVHDAMRDTLSRLTFDPADDRRPVWTPDGQRIVFSRVIGTTSNLYWQRIDVAGDVQRLTESKNEQLPGSWHPSGKLLAFTENNPETRNDIMILSMEGDQVSGWKPRTPTAFLNDPFIEMDPMFSPDGRWLAYASNESGRPEVYVRAFPGAASKWQISTDGATSAAWSQRGTELFFLSLDNRLMVASYRVDGDSFRAQKPRLWTDARFIPGGPGQRQFALHPDGTRIALAGVLESQNEVRPEKVVFVLNFFDELRRIAPVGRR